MDHDGIIISFAREKESLAATRFIGLEDKNVHFLKLPFYESGTVKKNQTSKAANLLLALFSSKIGIKINSSKNLIDFIIPIQ